MESVMCNISVTKGIQPDFHDEVFDRYEPKACYLYDIKGVTVMLHESFSGNRGKFSCSEYFTGYCVSHGETMQDALNMATEKINKYVSPVDLIVEKLKTTGYANKPEGTVCCWCGKDHMGGPEYCRKGD